MGFVPPQRAHHLQTSNLGPHRVLSAFQAVTTEYVIALLQKVPPKHCDLYPVPRWLVKKAAVVLAPVLCQMCNASLSYGTLPLSQKRAIVRPLLEKQKLEWTSMMILTRIDLSLIWLWRLKLFKRVVAARFMKHIDNHTLCPARQSAYCRFHSTETAIAAVQNDLIRAADADQVTALVLLDLCHDFVLTETTRSMNLNSFQRS